MQKLLSSAFLKNSCRFYVSEFRNTKTVDSRIKASEQMIEKRKKLIFAAKGQKKFHFVRPLSQEFEFDSPLTVPELSIKLGIPLEEFLKGMKNSLDRDQLLNMDRVEEICLDLDVLAVRKTVTVHDVLPFSGEESPSAPTRPAIVTIMGHVDHGKTTLLDKLRNANVVDSEFGGITQHIGAFEVKIPDGQVITFIDTPGHAAFTAMREAGAQATDIVVLVIAADDGIMAQTEEAIKQALNAKVKIVVAINKIDKIKFDGAVERIEKDLFRFGIKTESQGGTTSVIPISALHEKNLDKLLEEIVLQGAMLELRAKKDCPAEAVAIESRVSEGIGFSTSCVVQRGTLKVGAWIVSGTTYGKVKALYDFQDKSIKEAGPAKPVQIVGLKGRANAADSIIQVDSEEEAVKICEYRTRVKNVSDLEDKALKFEKKGSTEVKKFPVILKVDVSGTLDAVDLILSKFPRTEAVIEVFSKSVGKVTASDITNAKTIGGCIVCMNVKHTADTTKQLKNQKVPIHNFRIIYQLTDFFRSELSKLLPEDVKTEILGVSQLKQVFEIENKKEGVTHYIGGGIVSTGTMSTRATYWNVIRGTDRVFSRLKMTSLKRFKEEVDSVSIGSEFGITLEGYKPEVGDKIEAVLETITRREIKLID